jgi:hypothetical protein
MIDALSRHLVLRDDLDADMIFHLATKQCSDRQGQFDPAPIRWYLYLTDGMPSQADNRTFMKQRLADGR